MKTITKLFTIAIFVGLLSCSAEQENDIINSIAEAEIGYATKSSPDQDADIKSSSNSQEEINIADRKLIKTGDISFETDDLKSTKKRIVEAVKKYKAYISTDNETKNYGTINYNLRIRVPSKNFDKLIEEISTGVDDFDQKNIFVEDVTEEFLDVEARIKTKKELENRYIEILNKAYTVSDILNIERQIGELRTDIERYEGRLKYLKSQVSYSSLNINFYKTVSTDTKFGKEFSNGVSSGWDNLIWFFVLLTYIWPFIVLLIIAFYIFKYFRRKKKKS